MSITTTVWRTIWVYTSKLTTYSEPTIHEQKPIPPLLVQTKNQKEWKIEELLKYH